jgi:hypothetical protein
LFIKKRVVERVIGLLCILFTLQSFGFSVVNLNRDVEVNINSITLCKDSKTCEQPLLIFDQAKLYPFSKYSSSTAYTIPLAFQNNPEYPYVQFRVEGVQTHKIYRTHNTGCQITFANNPVPTPGTPTYVYTPGTCDNYNTNCTPGSCNSTTGAYQPGSCDHYASDRKCTLGGCSRGPDIIIPSDPPIPSGTNECCISGAENQLNSCNN